MYNSECVFALNHSSRSIIATSSSDKHRWLAGTCSITQDNELSLLEFDEENGILNLSGLYRHPDQVWCLAGSPSDQRLVVSSHVNKRGQHGVTLWRMRDHESPGEEVTSVSNAVMAGTPDKQDLLNVCNLKDINSSRPFANSIRWNGAGTKLLTSGGGRVLIQDIAEERVADTMEVDIETCLVGQGNSGDIKTEIMSNSESGSGKECDAATWDPHNSNCCIATSGSNVSFIDTRACTVTSSFQAAASGFALKDVDCNPNKPEAFITCGEDRLVRCWDSRSVGKGPVRTLLGHSHWAVTCRYNPFHDQLLLSAGTDNAVNLWRVASCSSSPWLGGEVDASDANSSKSGLSNSRTRSSSRSSRGTTVSTEEDDDSDDSMSLDPPDLRIRCIDQHSDSVYSLAWSLADAWSFCSVSFDGRVVLNRVPSSEKYKILL